MRVRDAELAREAVRGSLAARPDCDGNAGVGQPEISHERARDPTRSEDSPPHWAVRHVFVPSSTGLEESLTTWPAARLACGARSAGVGPVYARFSMRVSLGRLLVIRTALRLAAVIRAPPADARFRSPDR